jgi:phosphate transport system permease protein
MRLSKFTDKAATIFFWIAGLSIIIILAWFLIQILGGGVNQLSWSFITGKPSESIAGGGVGPQIFNSFYILFLSLIVSLPIGIGAGIYMAIYAGKNKFTELIRISVEALSSVPSIVLGLFGALLFVNIMGWSFSIQAGAATLALLNLPILVRITEASLALGSTKWQAIRKVLIPSAMPGLITGITLVSGRALGETAILIYTAGTSVARHSPFDLKNMGETLAVHLWYVGGSSLAPDAAEIAKGSAALLIIVVLVFNLFIALPSRMIQKRLSGGK